MAEERVQRRLAAILATDVVGFSRLMEIDEAGTLTVLKARRREVLEPLVAKHQGRVFKFTGDGALIEFASAVNAVQCAIDLQRSMAAANDGQSEVRRIVLRIGINLGDVMVEGSDLYGDGVNIAARLENIAEPGGICLSGMVHQNVKAKLALALEDLGEQSLRNIAEPVRVFRVRMNAAAVPASRPAGALPLPDKPSIAVLPFQNMSGDAAQEYFADGIVEEIITALSRFRGLFVIARNSSFIYKGRAADVKQVGRELGVRYVLEGSVRKAGSKIRITGQLIDSATGAHLWADRFDGNMEDVFDLQDHVTGSVVGAIAPKLEEAEIERIKRKPTESLDAYDHFLRGMAGIHKWTREGNDEALLNFYRAIELDPNYAAAHGLAARGYVQRNSGGWSTDRAKETAEARRLARRAAELGPHDALALCTAGFALGDFTADTADGDALIERALQLNPNLAWAWLFSGWAKVSLGKPDAAIERLQHAMRLSPQDPQIFSGQTAMASAHFVAGRYAEAIWWAETAIRERPNFVLPVCILAAGAAQLDQPQIASKAIERARQLDPRLCLANLNTLQIFRPEDFTRWADALRKAGLPE
jgi:TolB-like protein/Tfp pilus assembly protein PilF